MPIRILKIIGKIPITGALTASDRIKTTAVKALREDLETLRDLMNQNHLNIHQIQGLKKDKEKMMYSGTETVAETGTESERGIMKETEILIDQEQESQTEMETKT